jgi:hypothetical protein
MIECPKFSRVCQAFLDLDYQRLHRYQNPFSRRRSTAYTMRDSGSISRESDNAAFYKKKSFIPWKDEWFQGVLQSHYSWNLGTINKDLWQTKHLVCVTGHMILMRRSPYMLILAISASELVAYVCVSIER